MPSVSRAPQRRRALIWPGLTVALALVVGAVLPSVAQAAPQTRERYIVLTKTYGQAPSTVRGLSAQSAASTRLFKRVFPGYVAELTPAEVRGLKRDEDVRGVVADQRVHIAASTTQQNAPWGLDRIDQRSRTLNGTYTYDTTGEGVTAIVLDTGINRSNTDFRGRIRNDGYDYADGDSDPADCNGHGTHVAGIIGGTRYGVAKRVSILPLRILDCNGDGYTSDTVQALDDVAASADALQPAVVNLSLGGDPSREVDAAVNAVIAAGIPVVVAGGNAYPGEAARSACELSPARVPNAITVGASDRSDTRADFSYYGPCLDLWAPGTDIRSDWIGGSTASEVESGTSMAAPHVAGVIARWLSAHKGASPSQVRSALISSATPADVSSTSGSPHLMLYSTVYVPPTVPRTVTVTASTTRLAMTLKWAKPAGSGGSAIQSYEVRRSGTDAKGRTFPATTVKASARSYIFSGLEAGGRYTFSVRALNKAVAGPKGIVSRSTVTKPGKGRVTTPSAGSTSDDAVSITARWKEPSTGGTPARYEIGYRKVGTGTYTKITVAGSTASKKITGLARDAKYVVTVRPGNAAGWGATSKRSSGATAR